MKHCQNNWYEGRETEREGLILKLRDSVLKYTGINLKFAK